MNTVICVHLISRHFIFFLVSSHPFFGVNEMNGSINNTRFITCCAVAQSRVLRTAWVPYGNMETSTPHSSETSGFITMNFARYITSVRRTHLPSLVAIRPLEVAPLIREIYTSCDFSFFLPSFLIALFFLRTCIDQTDRDNLTHNGSRDAV